MLSLAATERILLPITGTNRREFIAALAGAAAWPMVARGQQVPIVGVLSPLSAAAAARNIDAFRRGMRELGYSEGRSVALEFRYADGHIDRLPDLAVDLVTLKAAVIVAGSPAAATAARNATRIIPIVMNSSRDPVAMGLVNSIRQPGGNVTGFWFGDEALIGKRIELLKEVLPRTTHVGLLVNPDDPADTEALQGSNMNSLGVAVRVIPVRSADELENAFATATREGLQGLEVTLAPLFIDHRAELAGLEMRHRLPTIYGVRENAVAGGLMSYGASLTDLYRRKAELVDKILRGARPADLPIERPIKFEFVLNLKTAKALGLDLPVSMQLLADQVIE